MLRGIIFKAPIIHVKNSFSGYLIKMKILRAHFSVTYFLKSTGSVEILVRKIANGAR